MKKGFLNRPGALSFDKDPPPKAPEEHANASATKGTRILIPTGPIRPPSAANPDPLSTYLHKEDSHWNIISLPPVRLLPSGNRSSLCILFKGVREKILANPSFPGPRLPTPYPLPYRISTAQGAGLGMFSTCDFMPGDRILIERPLLVYPSVIPHGPNIVMDPDQLFDTVLSALGASDRVAFWTLSNCKGSTMSEARGIIDTNSVGIGTLPGHDVEYGAVFSDISRINHSCSPNATGYWDPDTFSYRLSAVRPIRAGEQIYIKYCSSGQCRTDRQSELLSKYDFKCVCASCSLPKLESAKSDTRRVFLSHQSLTLDPADESALKAWLRDLSLPDDHIIKECMTIWTVMEEEGGCAYPEALWPALVQRICKAYCALGDLEGAREWAKKGATLSKVFLGTDAGWNKVFEAPQSTAWWELRVKAKTLFATRKS